MVVLIFVAAMLAALAAAGAVADRLAVRAVGRQADAVQPAGPAGDADRAAG